MFQNLKTSIKLILIMQGFLMSNSSAIADRVDWGRNVERNQESKKETWKWKTPFGKLKTQKLA